MNIVGVTGQSAAGKDVIASRLVEKHGYRQLALADPIKRFGLNVFGFDVIQLWGPAKNTFDPMYNECNLRSSGVTFEPGCSLAPVKRVCDQAWGQAAARLVDYGPEWVASLLPEEQQEQALKDLYFWFSSLGHHYPELSPRIMLQHLGTEWGREVGGEDIWVEHLVSTADYVFRGYPYEREEGIQLEENTMVPPVGVVVSDIRFENEVKRIRELGGRLVRVTRKASDRKANSVGILAHASEDEQKAIPDSLFDCILQNNGSIAELNKAIDVAATTFKGTK